MKMKENGSRGGRVSKILLRRSATGYFGHFFQKLYEIENSVPVNKFDL